MAVPRRDEWFLKVITDAGKRYSLEVKGDIATLSAEVVKPKLAEKTGVPARKQILTYKGKELGDKVSFQEIGIKPDDELRLSRKVPETAYYIDVVGDALRSFDDLLQKRGGAADFDSLPEPERKQLLKDLGRKLRSMKKNITYLREEDEGVQCERQIAQYQAAISDKEQVINMLENPALRLNSINISSVNTNASAAGPAPLEAPSKSSSNDLRRMESSNLIGRCRHYSSSPKTPDTSGLAAKDHSVRFGLNSVMLAFYERLQWLHASLYSIRKRMDESQLVAGSLLRVIFDLKILWQDVLGCRGTTEAELYVMQTLITDVRTVLIKTVAQFLSMPGGPVVSNDDVKLALTSQRAPYALRKSDLPGTEADLLDILTTLGQSSVVDVSRVLAVFRSVAGNVSPAAANVKHTHAAVLAAAPAETPPGGELPAPPPASAPSPAIHPTTGSPPPQAQMAAKPADASQAAAAPAAAAPAVASHATPDHGEMLAAAISARDLWRAWLILFYQRFNRNNLSSVDRILAEYKGTEYRLPSDLFEKYHVDEQGRDDLQAEFMRLSKEHSLPLMTPQATPTEEEGCTVM